jgi:hypothetical protein
MRDYRVYGLDDAGRIKGAEILACRDDAAAVDRGTELLALYPKVEVWELARLVRELARRSAGDCPTP